MSLYLIDPDIDDLNPKVTPGWRGGAPSKSEYESNGLTLNHGYKSRRHESFRNRRDEEDEREDFAALYAPSGSSQNSGNSLSRRPRNVPTTIIPIPSLVAPDDYLLENPVGVYRISFNK